MDVYLITEAGFELRSSEELAQLLLQRDAVVWVDMPICTDIEAEILSSVFGFKEVALRECLQRNHVSKIQAFDDHVFTVVHAPKIGVGGHVHYLELDQFLGRNYLVTVHGPLNPLVEPAAAFMDTGAVLEMVKTGELRPRNGFELSSAIIAVLTRHEIDLVADLAEHSGLLEQQVMSGAVMGDGERFLTELFQVWYELLAIRTMAVHASATYDRMASLARFIPPDDHHLVADLADRFEMVSAMADGQRELLHGIIEFFQTRISTHMTIAADEMAKTSVQQNDDMRKISARAAIVAVPTAITGFFGQNVPYPGFGQTSGFVTSSILTIAIAAILYLVFKRQR